MCGVVSALFGLLEVGVQLDLVDAGGHCGGTNQHIDVTGQEVADADMPDQSVTLCVDKSLPCLDVEALGRVGPVDQIQVEIIESEPAQAFLSMQMRALSYWWKRPGSFEVTMMSSRGTDAMRIALPTVPSFS